MAGGSMTSSSKELTAIIVNLKEARILDKAVQTLSLEESYAAKLLDLNSKMVKFNYKRLKNNVNKIKTYLKPEEISAMRSLEVEGKFKAEHPRICSSSSSTKIAAAHKRLNLNTYRRAQSAMPRMDEPSNDDTSSSETSRDQQSQSNDEPQISCSQQKPRPKTSVPTEQTTIIEIPSPRPIKSFALVLEKITKAQKANKIQAPQVSYSCHDDKPPDSDDPKGNRSVLDAFGPNPYEERRHKLLNMEGQTFTGLKQKKQSFVNQVERFASQNPPYATARPERTQEIIKSIDSMAARPGRLKPTRTASSLAARAKLRERAQLGEYAEIRKTRYLRVDESLIEISHNTLASDFLRKTEQWRRYKSQPLSFQDSAALVDETN